MARRKKLTKLDEAALLGDREGYARWLIHRARTVRGIAQRIVDNRNALTSTESAFHVEQAELWIEQAEELEAFAEEVRAGRAEIPAARERDEGR